jgi:hypothetical protein
MRKRLLVVLGGLILAIGMPSIAFGGNAFTMHPAGSGQKTYASWKANVGELDSNGTGMQAIFMQKNTNQQSLAVVVIRGLAGEPASSLLSVSWDRPTLPQQGSHCDQWPRWEISLSTGSSVQFGNCISQDHSQPAQEPAQWTRDICAGTCIPAFPPGVTINSLAIVFAPADPDFVLLDDITVESNAVTHTWMSASDNGTVAALNIGPAVAFADVVSDVLGDLLNLFPGVAVTDWTLYPGIDLTPLPTVTVAPSLPPSLP